MTRSEIVHDTFTIDYPYPSPPTEVFASFADPVLKRRWYAENPAFETLEYDLDFRPGGREVLAGRMRPATPIAGAVLKWTSSYGEIRPDSRIVSSQVVELNDRPISCALVTCEFLASDTGCVLRLTHQAAFFEGSDGPAMRKAGWQLLLAALASALSKR